ncbi:permease of the major facilitator superfamily [Massariosphaeria phaeospora]|uniref:Permease of the major facilitator superfamily n=1 Tax=Massariosphaeria phaeospora TaxID=100035 RepID=A0A7C8M7C8_9PLEO|nr:permease of the major facilitator superfamily [Massariosphaeria phaeospora]
MERHELAIAPIHEYYVSSPSPDSTQAHPPPTSLQAKRTKPPAPSTSLYLVLVIGSLYLGTFLVALDTTILGTVIPAITTDFHALDQIAWYGSSYLLALTALQPTFGKLYKVVDTKLLYLASIAVFEVGSIVCAAASSSPVFIVGRAVAGCGAAGLMQGSFAIVTKTVPLAKRPFYFGLFVSAFGVSIGIGPVLGGTLADRGMWRWCFWMNLPLGAVVILLVAAFLKLQSVDGGVMDRPSRSGRHIFFQLDPVGSILMIASVCCLLLAMQWGGQSLPWTSPKIITLFILSGILLVLFVLVEWKMGEDASVPFCVLKQRSIAFGTVYLFLFSMPNFSYGVYIPLFFQAVKGFSAQRSGAEILFLALTQILIVVLVGALVSRFGYYTPFIIGGTALSVIGSGLVILLDIDTTHTAWAAYFVICGIGIGAAINLPYTAVSTVLNEVDMVTGNALLQFSFQLGGAVSLCISQTVFLGTLKSGLQDTLPNMSVSAVIKAGAANLPALAESQAELHLLRMAYQNALGDVFIFLLVTGGLAFLASFGFEHKSVRKVGGERKEGDGGDHQTADMA